MRSHGWTEEHDRQLRELYPYMLNKELAAQMGCSVNTLMRKAKALGLKFADKRAVYHEQRSRILTDVARRDGRRPPDKKKDWKPAWTPESRAKLSNTRRMMYQRERRRLLFNLPPLTKIRVSLTGRGDRKRRKQQQINKS